MVYEVSENLSNHNELQLQFEDLDADGVRKYRYTIEKKEFFDDLRKKIENLNIRSIIFDNNRLMICETELPKDRTDLDSSYPQTSMYKKKLEKIKISKKYDTYEFDMALSLNPSFCAEIESILDYYKKYQEETLKRILPLEAKEQERREVYDLVEYLYDNYDNLSIDDSNLDDLERLKAALHVISSEDYVKGKVQSKYSSINARLTAWETFGSIIVGILTTIVVSNLGSTSKLPAVVIGILASGINVSLVSLYSKSIKDDINIESETVEKAIKTRLYNLCGLEYIKEQDEVVKTKVIELLR